MSTLTHFAGTTMTSPRTLAPRQLRDCGADMASGPEVVAGFSPWLEDATARLEKAETYDRRPARRLGCRATHVGPAIGQAARQ